MPTINQQPLPYLEKLAQRAPDDVTLAVIHCTELPDLAIAREYGEKPMHENGSGNSGHFYIDRDGAIYQYVPGDRVAHHVRGNNLFSIGIELVNLGRFPDWFNSRSQTMTEPYPAAQIASLRALLTQLQEDFANLRDIAGHEDLDTARVPASDDATIDVPRKRDPGPQFPWTDVLRDSGLRRIGAGF